MSRLHALYFMLDTSYTMCIYLVLASHEVFSYIHLMSTTQLDRSRSPTMPCILLVYLYIYIYIYPSIYIYIYIGILGECMRAGAIQLRSRHEMYIAKHFVRSKHEVYAHGV